MRKSILPAAVVAAALLTCPVVGAQSAQWMTNPNASGDVAVRDIVDPLAPVTITQNSDPDTLVSGTSTSCSDGVYTTENAWLRLFDLDDDHGLVGAFTVSSVDWGTESVAGALDITVNVYCLDEGLPFLYSFMELKDSAATSVADEVLTFHNTVVGGSCDSATEDMAVELYGDDCEILGTCTLYWIGFNNLGQIAPTYIASASCGIYEPTDLNAIGFGWHLVMTVNGDGVVGDDGGADDGGGGDAGGLTVEQEAKLLASDGAPHDFFGVHVALDGDTAIVGAYRDDDNGEDSGSAYVFTRTGGVWTEQAKLLASDGEAGDWFGSSVALDGDTAIIGAYGDDDNGAYSGSAYVFTGAGDAWTEQAKLLPADGAAHDNFGSAVAIDGDTAIVGVPYSDDNGENSGSAYVFTRTGDVWTERTKLLAADSGEGDQFGRGVALDYDTAIIGSPSSDDNGPNSGSAYVFTRAGNVWMERTKLLAADGGEGDWFGSSVAVDGDTAIIGVSDSDDNGSLSGSAYVFTRTGDAWTEQAKLLASDGEAGDRFGLRVAIDGDTTIIGAYQDDDNGTDSGSAYVFTRAGDAWTQQAKVLPADGGVNDLFGGSVAVDGDTAVIGAARDDDNGSWAGAAYVFRLYEGDVPATTGVGIVVLLLAVLGTGVYFMRRQTTG